MWAYCAKEGLLRGKASPPGAPFGSAPRCFATSTGFTIITDIARGDTRVEDETFVVGQSTTNSLIFGTFSNVSPEAAGDYAINTYALKVDENSAPGSLSVLGLNGLRIPLGEIAGIQFGKGK